MTTPASVPSFAARRSVSSNISPDGSLAPWVDKETLGPVVLGDYVYAYVVLALPVLFLTSALFFTLTTLTRSMMWTYVGLIALLVLRAVFAAVLSRPGLEH